MDLETLEMPNLTHCELADTLTARLDVIMRLRTLAPDGQHRIRPRAIIRTISDARRALAAEQPGAMQSALKSIDLLSFELCDD